MGTDPAIRELVGWIHEQSIARFDDLHPELRPKGQPLATTASFILGIASAVLATVVAVVTVSGLMGQPIKAWSEQGRVIQRPNLPPATIHLPSLGWGIMACVADGLGFAGILLGGRRRVSLLSAFGVLLASLWMVSVIVYGLIMWPH